MTLTGEEAIALSAAATIGAILAGENYPLEREPMVDQLLHDATAIVAGTGLNPRQIILLARDVAGKAVPL